MSQINPSPLKVGFPNMKILITLSLACGLLFTAMSEDHQIDRTRIIYGQDHNIKFELKGRAGNLQLQSAPEGEEGFAEADYQKGSGYVKYDRTNQVLECRSRISYTFNRLSRHIQDVAPKLTTTFPKNSELDVHIDVNSMGLGSLDFTDLHLSKFKFDVNYGDVDISFPTKNKSIIRGPVKFHLMTGDLEINQLSNLMADKIRINGGIGELSIDFGPILHRDLDVKIDQDIGGMDLTIPKGTHVIISGTSRDLSDFGFIKEGKQWRSESYHERSPTLDLRLKGPLGDLKIYWQ